MTPNRLSQYQPAALSLLRIVAGLLFLEHGTQKLFAFPVAFPMPGPLPTLILASAAIELVAGALIALGLATRLAAFVASGEMAVAYWMQHAPKGLWPVANMGDAAILYCFVFLYLVFAGPGPWSLDAMLGRRRRGPEIEAEAT